MQQRTQDQERLWKQLLEPQQTSLNHDAQLQALGSEEAVRLLYNAVAPRREELHPPTTTSLGVLGIIPMLLQLVPSKALQVIFMALFLLSFLGTLVFFLVECQKRRRRSERLLNTLGALAPNCRSTTLVPELMDFLHWLENTPDSLPKSALQQALARLLIRVSENELEALLTKERRQFLRALCRRSSTPSTLVTAALLVLGSVKDRETLPLVHRLVQKRPDLEDAAEAFLDAVR